MDDGSRSFLGSLKSEWQLLWASLLDGSDEEIQRERPLSDLFLESNLGDPEKFKSLSLARQRLFQLQESLKKEIQNRQTCIEEQKALGLSIESEEQVLDKLLDEGLKIETRIVQFTEQMEHLRRQEPDDEAESHLA
jgi:hypothetical protein